MKKLLPIGLSDYKRIIDDNYYYVDKTLFIDDILKYGGNTTLIPRPRRFGKTLNMSTLKYFFEKTATSNAYLFEDKKIWQLPERAVLQGKFPVIFMTFKDIKENTWQSTKNKLIAVIAAEYIRHKYVLKSDLLEEEEKNIFNKISNKTASNEEYHDSLKNLSEFLYRFHQIKPFILLDEYDSPIHSGFLNNYYSEVVRFTGGLMTGAFKDNTYLERGIITGILRTAKEGIFSGLNNLKMLTLLDDPINDKFGFTQQEVDQLLCYYDLSKIGQNFKDWYNGYLIGDGYLIGSIKIYNPWSSMNCVDNRGRLKSYWVNTSDNALIHKIVAQVVPIFKKDCADLMLGNIIKYIEIVEDTTLLLLDLNIHTSNKQNNEEIDINEQTNSIWSLLLFSGYVTPCTYYIVRDKTYTDLKLPNEELHELFKKLVKKLFRNDLKSINITMLYQALQNTDGEAFSEILSTYMQSISYHDIAADEPEKSYHLFVLGILVVLSEKYHVLSNRESGDGRYDIMLTPLDKSIPGLVIEFKKKDDAETMPECAERALEQIKERGYATQLVQQGVKKIVAFGIALHKKKVLLKQEELDI